jgi:hypothetical protein
VLWVYRQHNKVREVCPSSDLLGDTQKDTRMGNTLNSYNKFVNALNDLCEEHGMQIFSSPGIDGDTLRVQSVRKPIPHILLSEKFHPSSESLEDVYITLDGE